MAKILVVDDEEDVLNLFYAVLQGAGHEVNLFEDGREAIVDILVAQSLRRPFDLLLTALHMPEVNGMDMIAAVGFAGCLPKHVIVLSADFANQGKAEVCQEKVRQIVPETNKFSLHTLHKPISGGELLYAVEHILAQPVV